MVRWREFESREAASRALAINAAKDIASALETRPEATIVVSGGTTPGPFFKFLRGSELDWSRIAVLPSDERWVPTNHPDSNERMIRSELIQQRAALATMVSLYDAEGEEPVKQRMSQLALPFASVILGLGEDGHTASLFPGAPRIKQSLVSTEFCLMQTVPGLTVARISLTPKVLVQSKRINILFFGASKRAVFETALEAGSPEQFPVRAVLHQSQTPVEAWWAP